MFYTWSGTKRFLFLASLGLVLAIVVILAWIILAYPINQIRIQEGQPVTMESDEGLRVTITLLFVDPQTRYAEAKLEIGSQGTTSANMCPNRCGTSLGMGRPELNGVDLFNLNSRVYIEHDERWKRVNP